MEYTVHAQKGIKVGARSLRMIHVEASNANDAIKLAKAEGIPPGYKIIRVDHFDDEGRIVID
jgi:hypothetical protein